MKRAALQLVALQTRHIPEIQRYAADASVAATCNLPHPYPENGAEQFYRYAQEPRIKAVRSTFVIEEEGEFRGVCGVGRLAEPFLNVGEIGYWIGLPFWGQGVATRAARELSNFAFKKMKLEVLRGRCLEANPASRRVLEKCGFRLTRIGPEHYMKWSDPQATCFLELTREDWKRLPKR